MMKAHETQEVNQGAHGQSKKQTQETETQVMSKHADCDKDKNSATWTVLMDGTTM